MLRFGLGQLRHRRGRALALGAGTLAASLGFVLLTSAARSTEVRVRGSVESSFRAAYDILVRPPGSFTELERREGLVRPNYLSGIFGGITLDQYERIKRVRGVDVAAPIANIGFVLPFATVAVPLDGLLTAEPFQVYRVRFFWTAHGGASRYPPRDAYVYYTPSGRRSRADDECRGLYFGRPRMFGPFSRQPYLSCHYGRAGAAAVAATYSAAFPIMVAAIDPEQEARLVGLHRTVVDGRYLHGDDDFEVVFRTTQAAPGVPAAFGGRRGTRYVPVLVSTRTYVGDRLHASIERLEPPAGLDVRGTLASPRSYAFLTGVLGTNVGERTFELGPVYRRLVESGRDREFSSASYWTASPTGYRMGGEREVAPVEVTNPITVWSHRGYPDNGGFLPAPPQNQDVQFRRLTPHPGFNGFDARNVYDTPSFKIVGRFDPARLPGFDPLSRVPLETYAPPLVEPAGGGRPLLPTQNLGDYVQQPPLLLTTLKGMRPLLNPTYFQGARGRAPISVIRVRVAGVKGPDELSQARIRRVAITIRDATGLDVDITAGSSPRPLLVRLPPGKFGRPELIVREGWSKKGVSVSFLNALDSKRLALFALILVTCGFFLANGAFAVAQARRREIGTLLCLGWPPRAIFGVVLGELVLVGLAAGLVGSALAVGIAAMFSLDVPLWRSLLVAPVAVVLAVFAGLVPAWRASRSVPLDAVRPVIAGEVRGRRVRRLTTLALVNLRRVPARSLVAIGGLFVGVAALTLLIAVNRAFEGTLVGTLLGDAISIRVRGLDFVSVALVIGLAAMALVDVLFLNLRERAAEIVTLRSLGWHERHLRRLISLEACALGAVGGLAGALVGLALGLQLAVPVGWLAAAALLSVAGGVAVALLASLLPLSRLTRLTPPTVLADD